jgi:hypothetical protein
VHTNSVDASLSCRSGRCYARPPRLRRAGTKLGSGDDGVPLINQECDDGKVGAKNLRVVSCLDDDDKIVRRNGIALPRILVRECTGNWGWGSKCNS